MKLQNALTIFLAEYDKATTQRAYAGCLNPLLAVIGPAREADRVRPVDLIEYVQDLKSEERGLARSTIQKHIKTIKTFFIWMERLQIIENNPAKSVRQTRLPKAIDKQKAMTDAELQGLLGYFKYFPRNYAICLFLADTGCRAGGVAGLKIADLDLEHHRAEVTEKGDKTRPVAFGEETATALAEWLLKRPKCNHDHVFTWGKNPMTPAAISQIIRRGCKRVGIRSLGSHSLRHRKGHQLADAGVAPTVAATALGHSDPIITLEYYYPHDWSRAEEALQQTFVQPKKSDDKITKLG